MQDANGAAVAGAMVTLTNEATGVSFTTETSDSGTYSFDLVQVGRYTVTIEKQGFKKFISQGKPRSTSTSPRLINATLETGGLTETVTVQAGAEQVQTSTSGNIGSTIEQHTLEAFRSSARAGETARPVELSTRRCHRRQHWRRR